MTFTCRVLDRQIRVELSLLDDGLSVLLAGEDKSHTGAVSMAGSDGRTQTVDFPGHREREVAKQWTAVFIQICGCRTAVVCGIHYDGLAREGLPCVLKALDGLLHDVIRYVNETVRPVLPRNVQTICVQGSTGLLLTLNRKIFVFNMTKREILQ